jgi:cysteine-rich repeat protein
MKSKTGVSHPVAMIAGIIVVILALLFIAITFIDQTKLGPEVSENLSSGIDKDLEELKEKQENILFFDDWKDDATNLLPNPSFEDIIGQDISYWIGGTADGISTTSEAVHGVRAIQFMSEDEEGLRLGLDKTNWNPILTEYEKGCKLTAWVKSSTKQPIYLFAIGFNKDIAGAAITSLGDEQYPSECDVNSANPTTGVCAHGAYYAFIAEDLSFETWEKLEWDFAVPDDAEYLRTVFILAAPPTDGIAGNEQEQSIKDALIRYDAISLRCEDELVEEICYNGIDDDWDGLTDCEDPNCIIADEDYNINGENYLPGWLLEDNWQVYENAENPFIIIDPIASGEIYPDNANDILTSPKICTSGEEDLILQFRVSTLIVKELPGSSGFKHTLPEGRGADNLFVGMKLEDDSWKEFGKIPGNDEREIEKYPEGNMPNERNGKWLLKQYCIPHEDVSNELNIRFRFESDRAIHGAADLIDDINLFTSPAGCTVDYYCGDGLINAEFCDDGNMVSGDGCSSSCRIETEWECNGEPSICELICGNGVCDPGEQVSCIADCGCDETSDCDETQFCSSSGICLDKRLAGETCSAGEIDNIRSNMCIDNLCLNNMDDWFCSDTCGDGICNIGENKVNCRSDCYCDETSDCDETQFCWSSIGVPPGECHYKRFAGETCVSGDIHGIVNNMCASGDCTGGLCVGLGGVL